MLSSLIDQSQNRNNCDLIVDPALESKGLFASQYFNMFLFASTPSIL